MLRIPRGEAIVPFMAHFDVAHGTLYTVHLDPVFIGVTSVPLRNQQPAGDDFRPPLAGSSPHSLPTCPHYDWIPPGKLVSRLQDLEPGLFTDMLDQETKCTIIDMYLGIQYVK